MVRCCDELEGQGQVRGRENTVAEPILNSQDRVVHRDRQYIPSAGGKRLRMGAKGWQGASPWCIPPQQKTISAEPGCQG